jgi:hypothetical protein
MMRTEAERTYFRKALSAARVFASLREPSWRSKNYTPKNADFILVFSIFISSTNLA